MTSSTPDASLEDIRAVRGFAAAVVRRMQGKAIDHEIEEMINEAVALLYELHERWDPERCESFYAFCTTYLPLRLIQWWRREARQALLAHRGPGGKGYVYLGRVSLDEMADHDHRQGVDETRMDSQADRQLVTHDSHRVGE